MMSRTLRTSCARIAYHFVREGAARDEWRTGFVDFLTKALPSGEKQKSFVRRVLHRIFRD
jgi:hypothetical protein